MNQQEETLDTESAALNAQCDVNGIRSREAVEFLGHQAVSALLVPLFAMLLISGLNLLTPGKLHGSPELVRIALGAVAGFLLYRATGDRLMIWVWIGPLLLLLVALHEFTSATSLPLTQFWGAQCLPKSFGSEYAKFAMPPLSASAGYAVGAALARFFVVARSR